VQIVVSDMDRTLEKQLERNVSRTLLLAFFHVFLVIMPVLVPFFQSHGLSMRDVFLLQALFAAVVLVMEVPSGYFADLFGRRSTLIAGCLFLGIGHSLLLMAHDFWTLAMFEVALGIGVSLLSGADLAMLYDSEQALASAPGRRQQAVARLFWAHTTSEAAAAIMCSVLMLVAMQAVVAVQVVVGWIPLVLALTLVEPPGERLRKGAHVANMVEILRYLWRDSLVLRLTFLVLSIWALTTFYAVWLLQRLWQDHGVPLAYFGYLWALLTLTTALAGRFAQRLEQRLGVTVLLAVVGLAPVIGYVGLASFGLWGGLASSLAFAISRGLGTVVLRDALNSRVPGRYRATANSLVSFAFRGTFVLTAPLVGHVLELWGMATTLWLLGAGSLAIFAGLLVPLLGAIARNKGPNAPADAADEHERRHLPGTNGSTAGVN
jgi:predicted MFS family arabinose efflux permease